MNFQIVSYFCRNLFQKDPKIHDDNLRKHNVSIFLASKCWIIKFQSNIINLLKMIFRNVSYIYQNSFQKGLKIRDKYSQEHDVSCFLASNRWIVKFQSNIFNRLQISFKIVPYYRNFFQNGHEICNENWQKDIFQFFWHQLVEL